MNNEQAMAAITSAIEQVAPEVDASTLDPAVAFRRELDLDSLDFLNIVQALNDSTGVAIPDTDYDRVATLSDLASYLVNHAGA